MLHGIGTNVVVVVEEEEDVVEGDTVLAESQEKVVARSASTGTNGEPLPLFSPKSTAEPQTAGNGAAGTSNGQTGPRSAAAVPEKATNEAVTASKKNDFLSLDHVKAQLLKSYQDPFASLLQRQFFSDLLQSLTEATLRRALQAKAAAQRRGS